MKHPSIWQRYMYIHGTKRDDLLGQTSSHGCVRISNAEIMEHLMIMDEGDEVEIRVADPMVETS